MSETVLVSSLDVQRRDRESTILRWIKEMWDTVECADYGFYCHDSPKERNLLEDTARRYREDIPDFVAEELLHIDIALRRQITATRQECIRRTEDD